MLKPLFILVTFLASISAVGQTVKYLDIIGKWYEIKHKDTVNDFYFHDTTLFYAKFPGKQFDQDLLERFTYKLKNNGSNMFLEFTKKDSSFRYFVLISKINHEEILIQGNKKMDSTILVNPENIDSKHNWRLTKYHGRPANAKEGKPEQN
jgi:hypothetical protein